MSSREMIQTVHAPQAIGPYSQAIRAGGFLFCSGQIPLDPATGEMVGAGDVRVQAKRVLENVKAVLEAGGASLSSVVKTTLFLKDLQDFGAVNEIYASYFPSLPPARSTFQVAALPKAALVEIEAIALVG